LSHKLGESLPRFDSWLLITDIQAKEYLPAPALRKILALQSELVKGAPTSGKDIPSQGQAPRQPPAQRALLSANFANIPNPLPNGARAAKAVGRNIISAGDRLRDLIVPDALAAIISAPTWIPGMGPGPRTQGAGVDGSKAEKLRAELDDVLASNCPLCESVVASLDRPFVKDGEVDPSWTL
jgi:hypothetical protein